MSRDAGGTELEPDEGGVKAGEDHGGEGLTELEGWVGDGEEDVKVGAGFEVGGGVVGVVVSGLDVRGVWIVIRMYVRQMFPPESRRISIHLFQFDTHQSSVVAGRRNVLEAMVEGGDDPSVGVEAVGDIAEETEAEDQG